MISTSLVQTFGIDSVVTKFMHVFLNFSATTKEKDIMHDKAHFRSEFHGEFLQSNDHKFIYGFGVEGIEDVVHLPDNA